MDQLLLALRNKEHSQMPVIILPCVCCLKELINLQKNEENKCSCNNEANTHPNKEEGKKHHHHHHKLKGEVENSNKTKNKKIEINEKQTKRKHSIENELVVEKKKKKKKSHDVKQEEVNKSDQLQIEKKIEEEKEENKSNEEEEEEEKDDTNEDNNKDDGDDDNEFKIKKAEFRLRISKPQWIPPRVKYGERIDDNSKPKKKKRKPRKKQQKNDEEFIEKNRNSISFTYYFNYCYYYYSPAVEKSKVPYFNLQPVESEYEAIDNPLIGDKIQFKVFDCEMEGDEMSLPSFSESDPMIGDVIGKKVVDEVEHIEIKLENGETKIVLYIHIIINNSIH